LWVNLPEKYDHDVIFEVCTLALQKTRKVCNTTLFVLACGEEFLKARVHARWPLAVGSNDIKMTYWYPITSDTTKKDNNICNSFGPRARLPHCHAPVICSGFPSLIGVTWDWFMDCVLWGFIVSALDLAGLCWMIYSRCWTPKDSMWTWQDRHLKRLWKTGQRESKTWLTFHGKILPNIC